MSDNPPLRVLVTGSRNWTDKAVIGEALRTLPPGSTVVHGAARGADSIAAAIARDLGLTVEAHPADWDRFKKQAGRIRNQEMVDAGPYAIVFAFPLPGSIGTYDCMRRAERAGYEVAVWSPSSETKPLTQEDIDWAKGLAS